MKKYVIFYNLLLFTVFCNAQVLFTEDFNSYAVGAISNDITGTLPGKGGWYIDVVESSHPPAIPIPTTINDYQIIAETGRGNVFYSPTFPDATTTLYRWLFRNDIKTFWQQRTPGNNVLKISFDVYNSGDESVALDTSLFSNEGSIIGFQHFLEYNSIGGGQGQRGLYDRIGLLHYFTLNGKISVLPPHTWVTLEMYVDYNTSKIYYSIPMLNMTMQLDLLYTLQQNGEFDDSPNRFALRITNLHRSNSPSGTTGLKFDNLSISAQNTVPVVTTDIPAVVGNNFTVYPNPAINLVTINSTENGLIQQVQIYDVLGKMVDRYLFNNQTEVQLNTENLAEGVYMLHIQTNKGTGISKLIKK